MGKELLKQGFRWWIGEGESVKVWGDAWFQVPYEFKVITKN